MKSNYCKTAQVPIGLLKVRYDKKSIFFSPNMRGSKDDLLLNVKIKKMEDSVAAYFWYVNTLGEEIWNDDDYQYSSSSIRKRYTECGYNTWIADNITQIINDAYNDVFNNKEE